MLLIAIPLRLFWRAKLRPVELFLVKIGFAASVFTSVFSIVCAVFLLIHASSGESWKIIEAGLSHIMVCISLLTIYHASLIQVLFIDLHFSYSVQCTYDHHLSLSTYSVANRRATKYCGPRTGHKWPRCTHRSLRAYHVLKSANFKFISLDRPMRLGYDGLFPYFFRRSLVRS